MNYEIISTDEGKKFVNFILTEEEKRHLFDAKKYIPDLSRQIQKDENLKEFFNVPNIRTLEHNSGYLFSDHIKDALEEVRDGIGDVISTGGAFNSIFAARPSSVRVRHYLDREYGESLKEKTIEGWKDSEFCYSIMIYNRNSFGPGYFVSTDYDFYVPVASNTSDKIMQFDSYQEAVKVADSLESESKRMLSDLESLPEDVTAELYDSVMKKYHNVVRYGSSDGLICFHNSLARKIQDDENPWIIRVVQDVKLKKE